MAGQQDWSTRRMLLFQVHEHGSEPLRHALHRLHPVARVVRVFQVQRPNLGVGNKWREGRQKGISNNEG